MKKREILLAAAATILAVVSTAQAHSLWINSFESHVHKPGHTMVSLGWGHTLPMDDILTSPNGRVAIESFELIDVTGKKTPLHRPEFIMSKPEVTTTDFDLFNGDLAVQKIALKEGATPGVYTLSAISKPAFYTQYIDTKGKKRLQMKPKDELKDIDKVMMSVKYQAFAKSYVTVGSWVNPKPLGHGLEIIPRTDLSNLHKGDLVEVDVLFYGQPLNTSAKSMDFITAASPGFGQSDGFALMSYITEGKAQIRVQCAGQWVMSISHKDEVTQDGPMKDLMGKTEQVFHGASLTFTVK